MGGKCLYKKTIIMCLAPILILTGCTYHPAEEPIVYKTIQEGQEKNITEEDALEVFTKTFLVDDYTLESQEDKVQLTAAINYYANQMLDYEENGDEVPRELVLRYNILKVNAYDLGLRMLSNTKDFDIESMKSEYINIYDEKIPDYTFGVHNKGAQVTKYLGNETDVTIPKHVGGIPITHIGNSSFANKNLTQVDIPETVIVIGQHAFLSNSLKKVKLPSSLKTVQYFAFSKNELEELKIPNSLSRIEKWAFDSNKIKELNIPDTVTYIGESTFEDNLLTELVIPNSLTYIDESAFESNNITKLYLPDTITHIGKSAFAYNNLTEVVIPDSVTTIDTRAFLRNDLLTVSIPKSVITIGDSAFKGNKLTYVEIYESTLYTKDGEPSFDSGVDILLKK